MFKKITERFLGSREKPKPILWLAVILVLLLLIFWIYGAISSGGGTNFGRLANWADFTKYQAVFLSNGQVYFGKVTDANSQTLVLEDIYYLRSSKSLQSSNETGAAAPAEADNLSLVKLGKEIHGPEDKMSINLSQVLFVENLQADSKVVAAIRAYESK